MLKYQAIAADLREKITRGIYQPDDQLPPDEPLPQLRLLPPLPELRVSRLMTVVTITTNSAKTI